MLLTYSEVQDLDSITLNEHCKAEGIPTSYPHQAKVNLLCISLGIRKAKADLLCEDLGISKLSIDESSEKKDISLKWNAHVNTLNQQQLDEYASLAPDVLAKLKNWSKSIDDVPDVNDIAIKAYLTNTKVIDKEMSRTYKLSKPYEMRESVHSMWYHRLPNHPSFTALQAQCNPSQSTSSDNVQVIFVLLDSQSGDPVGGYCTCDVGVSQPCAHIGAALFCLAGLVACGETELPSNPPSKDIPSTVQGDDETGNDPGINYMHGMCALMCQQSYYTD